MRFLKQGFVWQFAGGFALGALALVASQSPDGRHTLATHLEHVARRG
ncbi:MAG: hypothetical protein ACRYFW_02745 [Janthinobacterium lividum]